MKIIEIDTTNIELEENNNLNLVLGYFDGVHIGHQKMISEAVNEGDTGVMTFDISPSYTLGKSIKYSHITSLYDKSNILKDLGVKYLYVLRVSKELLEMSKEDFIEKILLKINPKRIYIGSDYHFGKGALGDKEDLKKVFDVKVSSLLCEDNKKISSRAIRELIANGDMKKAHELLGRPYSVSGMIIEGSHNGEKIGFPTANLELTYPYVLPRIGVYTGYVKLLGRKYKAIISMSTHPTIMELKDPIIEVHLLNFKDNLYGKEIEVQFIDFIREIQRFNNLEELKVQLEKDREYAKNNLS